MRKLTFLPSAESEVAAAAEFYNSQQAHLGKRFISAIQDGTARVRVDPYLYPIVDGEVRRCLIRTFPFCILYEVAKRKVVVVAVMHLHRRPGYWKE